ncbi:MAG: hypothetical protein ACJA2W_003589, partial [Planctomycetota bacterium]
LGHGLEKGLVVFDNKDAHVPDDSNPDEGENG